MSEGARRNVSLANGRLRILRVALAHWADALKRVSSRVQGMGYHRTAGDMRRDRELIKGDSQNQGLLERLNPQGNLLADEGEDPEDGQMAMSHPELRLSYYAVKKHRERILDLKRKNEKEEYDTAEQDHDLDIIGEPRGDDGTASTGFLYELDLGWEEPPGDLSQMELEETGGGGAVEIHKDVMDHVRERLMENPDLENKRLFEECIESFPEAGLHELTLRQFHARYPLQVKRAMAQEGS